MKCLEYLEEGDVLGNWKGGDILSNWKGGDILNNWKKEMSWVIFLEVFKVSFI